MCHRFNYAIYTEVAPCNISGWQNIAVNIANQ